MKTSRVYEEVWQIIEYLPEVEYKRIPKEVIELIDNNRDKSLPKVIKLDTDISNITISNDATALLVVIFGKYIATDKQKVLLDKIITLNDQKNN